MRILSFLLFLVLFSCSPQEPEVVISKESIKKHMAQLASDEFQGRMPCTEGETKTVDYLVNEMKAMNLLPANGNEYIQNVPLIDIKGKMDNEMTIQTPKEILTLTALKDFVIHTERPVEEVSLNNSELVFCGYGIVSEKDGWNDYAGIDMKGKTAVVLVNDPGFGGEDTTFFKGNTMTYGGRWDRKYDVADMVGADGLIIIHETASAGYPWFVVRSSWSGSLQGLDGIDRSQDAGIKGWITLDVAGKLFESCGKNLSEMIKAARKPGFTPINLNAKVNARVSNTFNSCTSQNVAGLIKGSKYPDEYVVYTAHWDHIGIGEPVDGDSIYNGALDNASGVSTVLAIAEGMAKKKPERSVVFLIVTAEEQGLLGSEYYVENPLFPLEKTVVNLNMDGVNPAGRMKDLTITGKGHSEMDKIAAEEAAKDNRYVKGESEPEKGSFFRSDQFNFARKGVPVLYAEGGYEHEEKGIDYVKEFKDTYVASRYHAPADNYIEAEWNYDGMIQDGQLYYNIGWNLSNNRIWPQWYKESEFSRPDSTLD